MDALRVAVKDAFGFELPTPIQLDTIKAIMDKERLVSDVIIRSRTGSGKTLGFILPILQAMLEGQLGTKVGRESVGTSCIVVVPTRELAIQTGIVLEKLLAKLKGQLHWIVPGVLSGGDKRKAEKARLRKQVHIVVATPGRLLDHLNSTQMWAGKTRDSLRWLIVDEADRLMDMGFTKTMGEVFSKLGLSPLGRKSRLVLCSATIKQGTDQFAGLPLKAPLFVSPPPEVKKAKEQKVIEGDAIEFNAPSSLSQKFIAAPTKLRFAVLLGLLKKVFVEQGKVVLFTLCCDSVDFLYTLLGDPMMKEWVPTDLKLYRLHGGLSQQDRVAGFKSFVNCPDTARSLLVCTDIAARGLNLERVTAIIQYDAPCDLNDYLHRAGRTARQKENGQSILFLMPSEKEYVGILRGKGMAIGSISWDSFLQWLPASKKSSATTEKTELIEDEEGGGELDEGLRIKFTQWQFSFEKKIKENAALLPQAQTAYLSTVRAYATHASGEKQIFHIKRLHLGHLASTFGLSQPPTSFAAHKQKEGTKRALDTTKGAMGKRPRRQGGMTRPKSKMGKTGHGTVSEFGAGDIASLFKRKK